MSSPWPPGSPTARRVDATAGLDDSPKGLRIAIQSDTGWQTNRFRSLPMSCLGPSLFGTKAALLGQRVFRVAEATKLSTT